MTARGTGEVRKLLLIASSGGHLAELLRLEPLLNADQSSLWVTFKTPQTETLLHGRRVVYLPYIRPRGGWKIVLAMVLFWARLGSERFDGAVSTGSGIALACLPVARLRRIPTTYIESMGRTQGPSATGRVLQRLGGHGLYTQHARWAGGGWSVHANVLTTYRAVEVDQRQGPPRLFVTLGTIEGFRFDALVDAVLATGLADDTTVWQLGETTRAGLPGRVHRHLATADYEAAARDADVVVSHAGVGTLLSLLDLGHHPLMVARRAHRSEHVDDHQTDMEHVLEDLEVGRYLEVEDLTRSEVLRAARHRTTRVPEEKAGTAA